jgi:hypothetical protein
MLRSFFTEAANAFFGAFYFLACDFVIAGKTDKLFGSRMPAVQNSGTFFTAGADSLGTDMAGQLLIAICANVLVGFRVFMLDVFLALVAHGTNTLFRPGDFLTAQYAITGSADMYLCFWVFAGNCSRAFMTDGTGSFFHRLPPLSS